MPAVCLGQSTRGIPNTPGGAPSSAARKSTNQCDILSGRPPLRNVAGVPELQVTRIKPCGHERSKFFFVMNQSGEWSRTSCTVDSGCATTGGCYSAPDGLRLRTLLKEEEQESAEARNCCSPNREPMQRGGKISHSRASFRPAMLLLISPERAPCRHSRRCRGFAGTRISASVQFCLRSHAMRDRWPSPPAFRFPAERPRKPAKNRGRSQAA